MILLYYGAVAAPPEGYYAPVDDSSLEALTSTLHEIIDDPLKNKVFLVMDYLPGGTLAQKIEQTRDGLSEE